MNPSITNISDDLNTLNFTLQGVNVSLANAIRRIILSDIPTIVFRTIPYEKNRCTIDINTTRMNNEIIKQRLGCIPIHIDDIQFPIDDYIIEVDLKNDTNNIIYVTTKDFKIKNVKTNIYLTEKESQKIFPPDSITGYFIDFLRLRPKIADNIDGEHIKLSCKFDIGTANEDGMYNVVSTCCYGYTPDQVKINNEWSKKEKELKQNNTDPKEIEYIKNDWFLLEAKRNTIPNSFDFTIETIGVFKNIQIVKKACQVMIDKLQNLIKNINSKFDNMIENTNNTMENCYDIVLENEDYTLGKVIEFILYDTYYVNNKTISFCGFRKPHPHIDKSLIRIAFNEPVNNDTIMTYINNSANNAIDTYNNIIQQLSN